MAANILSASDGLSRICSFSKFAGMLSNLNIFDDLGAAGMTPMFKDSILAECVPCREHVNDDLLSFRHGAE
jgi:hypothetical protein